LKILLAVVCFKPHINCIVGNVEPNQIQDDYEEGNPLSSFTVGQKVKGKVLQKIRVKKTPGGPEHVHMLEMSMRPSQLSGFHFS